jgi:hypothetical protein
MLYSLVSALLVSMVSASPNGAPGCKVNEEVINRGMGPQVDMGYRLEVRPGTTPTSFTVQITNTQNRVDYQGLLIYVTTLANRDIHYGKWTFRNQTKWKYQDPAACQRANVVGPLESTFTHALPARVPTSVLFTWTASSIQEAAIPGLIISAAVAANEPGVTTKPRWQKLAFTPIGTGPTVPEGGAGLPGGAGSATDTSPVATGSARSSTITDMGGSLLTTFLSLFL